jgi:hypothetical protein
LRMILMFWMEIPMLSYFRIYYLIFTLVFKRFLFLWEFLFIFNL